MGLLGKDPSDMECYGNKFRWSILHQKPQQLNDMLHTYDDLSTKALDRLDEIALPAVVPEAPVDPVTQQSNAQEQETVGKGNRRPQGDQFKLLKEHIDHDETIRELWNEVNTVPDWVDWNQIERGQKVFWRYAGASVTALMYLSLLGGLGSGRTVETLDRTGGFAAPVVRRRLLETTQHTLDVHRDLESIKPGGKGWESSIRVRLLHTSVRRRIMRLAKEDPGYYNMETFGIPINDLDCVGTINTFSATLVWLGFPRQGIFLNRQETLDFLALWRYIAYIMGTPHDWLRTPEEAKAMMESLLISEVKPTKKSGTLANNIIKAFEGTPPMFASREFLNAQTWWLNGGELSSELKIVKPNFYHTALVLTQCWVFMLLGYASRSIPSFDERNIKFMKEMLYDHLVENKAKGGLGYKALFTFKWLPDRLNPTTPPGVFDSERREKSGVFKGAGIERLILAVLILNFILVGIVGYTGGKVAHAAGLAGLLRKYFVLALPLAA